MARATVGNTAFSGSISNSNALTFQVTNTTNGSTAQMAPVWTVLTGAVAAVPASVTIAKDTMFLIPGSATSLQVSGVTLWGGVYAILTSDQTPLSGATNVDVVVTLATGVIADRIAGCGHTVISPRQRPAIDATPWEHIFPISAVAPGTTDIPFAVTTIEPNALLLCAVAILGGSGNALVAGASTTQNRNFNTGAGALELNCASSMVAVATSTATPGTFTLHTTAASNPTAYIGWGVAWSQPSPALVQRGVPAGQPVPGKSISINNEILFPKPTSEAYQWKYSDDSVWTVDGKFVSGTVTNIAAATASTVPWSATIDSAANPGRVYFRDMTPTHSTGGVGQVVRSGPFQALGAAVLDSLSINTAGFSAWAIIPLDADKVKRTATAVTAAYNTGGTAPASVEWAIVTKAALDAALPLGNGMNAINPTVSAASWTAFSGPTILTGNITTCNIPDLPPHTEWMVLGIRTKSAGGTVLATCWRRMPFRTGLIGAAFGSSTFERGLGYNADGTGKMDEYRPREETSAIRMLDTTYGRTVAGAVFIPPFACGAQSFTDILTALSPTTGVGIDNEAVGGSKLDKRLHPDASPAPANSGWAYTIDVDGNYQKLVAGVKLTPLNTAGMIHFLVDKCDSFFTKAAVVVDSPPSLAAEVTSLQAFATNIRTNGATGLANPNVLIFGTNMPSPALLTTEYQRAEYARGAASLWAEDANIYMAANSISEDFGMDQAHETGPGERFTAGCVARAVCKIVLGINTDWRPLRLKPSPNGFTGWNDNGTVATFYANFDVFSGTQLTTPTYFASGVATGMTGFEFCVDGTFAALLSHTAEIDLTQNPPTRAKITVATGTVRANVLGRLFYGGTPAQFANGPYDNGSVPLSVARAA